MTAPMRAVPEPCHAPACRSAARARTTADRSPGERSGGWGCFTPVATEATLFGYLIFSYRYLASQTQPWPPEGMLKLGRGLAYIGIPLSSRAFVRAIPRHTNRQHQVKGRDRGVH